MGTNLANQYLQTTEQSNCELVTQSPDPTSLDDTTSSNPPADLNCQADNNIEEPQSIVQTPTKPGYDNDTVVLPMSMMKKAGYGNRKKQKKSLKNIFSEAVKLAEESHGIKRTDKGWQKKFTRIKQEYSAFIAKLKQSGRDGDDEDLFNTPDFFQEMHELEQGRARYDPPANYSTDENCGTVDLPDSKYPQASQDIS